VQAALERGSDDRERLPRIMFEPRATALIFDFDGVIIDSEVISIDALIEEIGFLGVAISREEAMTQFLGRRWTECAAKIATLAGQPVSEGLYDRWIANILKRCNGSLKLVSGVRRFLGKTSGMPRCIASSSSPGWIERWLNHFALAAEFDGLVLSGNSYQMAKPDPEIFLTAAARLGVSPESAVVIEDSPVGIEAARAAGMRAVALCAGSHMTIAINRRRLLDAGPSFVAESYSDLARWLQPRRQRLY
jgi:HAD superfamily hydrolase (TIGR01509 family)